MIGEAARLGDAPRLGSRKLSLVFAIGTVVDNRTHARTGERLDIRAIEPAGDAQSGRQGNKLRCHAALPGYLRSRSFAALDPAVTRKIKRRTAAAAALGRRRGPRTARAGEASRRRPEDRPY